MNDKVVIGIIIVTLVVIVGGVVFVSKTKENAQVETNANAKAVILSTSHDWGEIGINDGNVEHTFSITNEGEQPLKLFRVQTSCMCTTAQVIVGDKTSPLFGMHSRTSYVAEVPPKETAQVKVVFDPAYHGPNGVGSITRQVKLQTNDPNSSEIDLTVTAVVVQ